MADLFPSCEDPPGVELLISAETITCRRSEHIGENGRESGRNASCELCDYLCNTRDNSRETRFVAMLAGSANPLLLPYVES